MVDDKLMSKHFWQVNLSSIFGLHKLLGDVFGSLTDRQPTTINSLIAADFNTNVNEFELAQPC